MPQECCLCSQIAGDKSNDLIARMLPGKPYARRVMLEVESFVAIPSLGPLEKGQTLLCPKAHIRSFAQLETHQNDEYQAVKKELRRHLSTQYNARIHLFEHGMAATGGHVLCTTDHAHMHFVPLPDWCDVDSLEPVPWIEFDGSLECLSRLTHGREYVSYEPVAGECRLLIALEKGFESQYMRKLLARALGRPDDWNWHDNPDPKSADETWRRFRL